MDVAQAQKKYLPMSETMFCILFALREERHGYGVMQYVLSATGGRVKLGAGTVYQTLGKLERDKLIRVTREADRKKEYVVTETGAGVLYAEARRITALYELAKELIQ